MNQTHEKGVTSQFNNPAAQIWFIGCKGMGDILGFKLGENIEEV